MGENTKIEWAHHTFNPWMGCTKVSAGCAHCYAVAKHIESMRGQSRWGVGSIDQAFAGYAALPAPTAYKPWRKVMGYYLEKTPNVHELKDLYRILSRERHPDNGGTTEAIAELNQAYADAKKELGYNG